MSTISFPENPFPAIEKVIIQFHDKRNHQQQPHTQYSSEQQTKPSGFLLLLFGQFACQEWK